MTRIKTWLGLCLAVLLLIGCGGGGEGADPRFAGVGSGGTGSTGRSYVAGVVTAVGEDLVVNGVHFDAADADVRNINHPADKLTTTALQPGMMVEVDGSGIETRDGRLRAKALHVRIASQVLGRVLGVQGVELIVLGMKVQVTEHTLYDPDSLPNGLADIALQDVIEVHGFLDSTRKANLPLLVATRVIRRTEEVNRALFVIQGLIEAQTDSRYKLVGLPFVWQKTGEYASGHNVVRLAFPASILDASVFPSIADLSNTVEVTLPRLADDATGPAFDAYLDGVVTAYDPVNRKRFWLGNIMVNAEGAPEPACGMPEKGERVRLRGSVVNGEITASEIQVLDKAAPAEPSEATSETGMEGTTAALACQAKLASFPTADPN